LIILGLGFAGYGCHSQKNSANPSIEFTHIPPAAQGGKERLDTISGLVRNARPKQRIVIYAHSGQWWVQPEPDRPFIPIKADSTMLKMRGPMRAGRSTCRSRRNRAGGHVQKYS